MHINILFGYLDAGTGSVVIQSVIGIVAGIGVFGRKVFSGLGHKIKALFTSEESGKVTKKS